MSFVSWRRIFFVIFCDLGAGAKGWEKEYAFPVHKREQKLRKERPVSLPAGDGEIVRVCSSYEKG